MIVFAELTFELMFGLNRIVGTAGSFTEANTDKRVYFHSCGMF